MDATFGRRSDQKARPEARWTDFNRGVSGGGMAGGPFQCGIQIWHVNDAEAGEKFFRLGIRTIVNLSFPVADRDRRRGLRRLESRAADKDARSLKGLTVGHPGRHGGCVIATVEVFL